MLSRLGLFLSLILLTTCSSREETPGGTSEKERFVWDFDHGKTYHYSFRQTATTNSSWGGAIDHRDEDEVVATAELKVKSKGEALADLVLSDLKANVDLPNPNDPSGAGDPSGRTLVIQDVSANGTSQTHSNQTAFIVDFMFPLPNRDLKKGEQLRQPLSIPFRVMGSQLFVEGYLEMEYVEDLQREGEKLALLKSRFLVDQLEVPEEIPGEFSCTFKGDGEYLFNYREHYFTSAKVNVETQMSSSTGEDTALGGMEMSMESVSEYLIEFLSVEEQ